MEKVLKETVSFSVKSILAGILIAIATIACLFALKEGSAILGSVLFSFALVMIILLDIKLFTGVISRLAETPLKKYWRLPLCFLFNLVGILLVGIIVNGSILGDKLGETAASIVKFKLSYGLLSSFLTAILCGICISISTIVAKDPVKRGLQPIVAIMFPVVIFVYCGFEHSVADLAYFVFAKTSLTWEVVAFFGVVIAGNLIGGSIILFIQKLCKKFDKDDEPGV